MTQEHVEVKGEVDIDGNAPGKVHVEGDVEVRPTNGNRFIAWIDRHPRTGWYIASFGAVNVALNLADLFIKG